MLAAGSTGSGAGTSGKGKAEWGVQASIKPTEPRGRAAGRREVRPPGEAQQAAATEDGCHAEEAGSAKAGLPGWQAEDQGRGRHQGARHRVTRGRGRHGRGADHGVGKVVTVMKGD